MYSASNLRHFICTQLKSPKLQTLSKKPLKVAQRQFINRKSNIGVYADQPFFMHWKKGRVENIYAPTAKSISEENFKKGIAALFQVYVLF